MDPGDDCSRSGKRAAGTVADGLNALGLPRREDQGRGILPHPCLCWLRAALSQLAGLLPGIQSPKGSGRCPRRAADPRSAGLPGVRENRMGDPICRTLPIVGCSASQKKLSGVQVLVNEDLAVVEDGRAGDARIVVRRQRLGAFFDSLDQRFGCNRESSMLKQSKRSRSRCSGTAAITG